MADVRALIIVLTRCLKADVSAGEANFVYKDKGH